VVTHEMGFAREVSNRMHFLHEAGWWRRDPPERILTEPDDYRTQKVLSAVL
jgi:ABC-type polar amino acid transport system ATPase subunit